MNQMKRPLQKLTRSYAALLRNYLTDECEAILEAAYELGRQTLASGLGVLDLARAHLDAREKWLRSGIGGKSCARLSRLAGNFFLQTLSPFEATHRGFQLTNAELLKRNAELEREIGERRRVEKALQELSRKILHAQEAERRRISRELHDEVGQSLTAISVMLAALKNNGAAASPGVLKKVAATQRLLEETMETVHNFARELRPAMLDELGLLPALRSHVKNFSEHTGLRIRLRADAVTEKLSGEQKIALFRVAQESLTNVARHANASRVDIALFQAGNGVCLKIADNGKSFRADPENVARQKQRLGLLGMQERVRLVGGQFRIQPKPGRGTIVNVIVPFKAK